MKYSLVIYMMKNSGKVSMFQTEDLAHHFFRFFMPGEKEFELFILIQKFPPLSFAFWSLERTLAKRSVCE